MKIALVGGTGNIGRGLALRWALKHEVLIGSRSEEKARACVLEYSKHLDAARLIGCNNVDAVSLADVVVLCVPFEYITTTLESVKHVIENKCVISPVVPMRRLSDRVEYAPPEEGSAALLIRKLLPESASLAATFHTVPARSLTKTEGEKVYDVVVCGEDRAKKIAFELAIDANLRPFDGGPLENSPQVESLTPLLINLGIYNNLKNVGIKFLYNDTDR